MKCPKISIVRHPVRIEFTHSERWAFYCSIVLWQSDYIHSPNPKYVLTLGVEYFSYDVISEKLLSMPLSLSRNCFESQEKERTKK